MNGLSVKLTGPFFYKNMPNLELTKNQKIVFFILAVFLTLIILMIVGILPGLKKGGKTSPKTIITLEFWGIDSEEVFQDLINRYQLAYPQIKINYHQIDPLKYENALINALASRKGPDILMIRHDWLLKHWEKLYPAPYISPKEIKETFPEVVVNDLILNNQVYGLPLWIDTLALYYNKDLFNGAGIPLPPKTWQEFQEYVQILTQKNESLEIEKAGAALGTANNISYPKDILALLILQTGSPLTNEKGEIVFEKDKALKALNFYLNFANPSSANYSWNKNFPNDLEAFAQGKVAMIFAYSADRTKIEAKNPYLNYGISYFPQTTLVFDQIKNYATYWALAVSATSAHYQTAWNFVSFLVDNTQARYYMEKTGKPPARKILIQETKNDEEIGIFSYQALSAKSFKQKDPDKYGQIFKNIIESISIGQLTPSRAIEQLVEEINGIK